MNFRANLIRGLAAAGYEVVAIAPPDEYAPRLAELGCRYVPLSMDNKGTHPGRDLLLFWRFLQLLRKENRQSIWGIQSNRIFMVHWQLICWVYR